MKNFRSYSFWTAFAGAITILVSALGKCFGFSIDNQIITDVIMAIAGVLVVLGVVTMPKTEGKKNDKVKDNQEENKETEE